MKGVLVRSTGPFEEEALRCLQDSIDLARTQGAGSFELRATIDLAALLRDLGDRARGREILQGVYVHFTEGFETTDLKAAADLIHALR